VRKYFQKIIGKEGTFRQNVFVMSGGSLINVFISLGLYPIVTRLYTKADIGNAGLFTAVVGLIAMGSTGMFPTGLVIPKLRREFYGLLKLSLISLCISIFFVVFIIIFSNKYFIRIFNLETISHFTWLIPIGVILYAAKSILLNWNVRKKEFKINASSNVATALTTKILNIINALLIGASVLGLIFSSLISILLATTILGTARTKVQLQLLGRITWQESLEIGRRYRKYPFALLPANLINKYTADLPIYLLTSYFSPAITGAFILANNIMRIPLNVISNSLSSVFLQKANELYLDDPSKMSSFALKVNRRMLLAGIATFGTLFAFGDIVFPFVFGLNWSLAGRFASILSCYYIFRLITTPMAKIFRVIGKEEYSLYVNIILASCRTIGIYFGVLSGGFMKAITLFTIANIIGYIITYIFVFKACKLPVFRVLLETMVLVVIGYSILYLSRRGLDNVLPVFYYQF